MTWRETWPRSVGGHVTLDFVNTELALAEEGFVDVLGSTEEFSAWCDYAGLATAAPTSRKRAFLAEAVALRTAFRSVFEAVAAGRPADPAALARLQGAYASAVAHAVPELDNGRLAWTWDPTDPRAALCELTGAAVDLLRAGETDRLKACPACGFLFLDATKNGGRRWCSMDDCGKAEKMRRYVAKRARGRSPGQEAGDRDDQ